VLNRIPIFVIGRPGSSKTLTMQVTLKPMKLFFCVFDLFDLLDLSDFV
jgi:hypothetical protein